jgi:hypothetical protein
VDPHTPLSIIWQKKKPHFSTVQTYIHLARSCGPINTYLDHHEPQYLSCPSIPTHASLHHPVPHTPISSMWATNTFLNRPNLHTPPLDIDPTPHASLSILLIMHAPLSVNWPCTHLSLGNHIHFCWSYGPMHTYIGRLIWCTIILVIWPHLHLSLLKLVPTYAKKAHEIKGNNYLHIQNKVPNNTRQWTTHEMIVVMIF